VEICKACHLQLSKSRPIYQIWELEISVRQTVKVGKMSMQEQETLYTMIFFSNISKMKMMTISKKKSLHF
jgi:hypothetical protein